MKRKLGAFLLLALLSMSLFSVVLAYNDGEDYALAACDTTWKEKHRFTECIAGSYYWVIQWERQVPTTYGCKYEYRTTYELIGNFCPI